MLNDLYIFDVTSLTWFEITDISIGAAPSPRARLGLVTSGDKIFLFGGYERTWYLGECQ